MIITKIFIELSTYHDSVVGRVVFVDANGVKQESNLYSTGELNNLIQYWKADQLQGSFAIGTTLAADAIIELC